MSMRLPIMLASMLAASVTADAAAQWNVTRFDGPVNRGYITIGLDPALVTSVGYGRVVPVFGHPLELTGDVGLGVAELDTHDFRARLRALTSIMHWRTRGRTARSAEACDPGVPVASAGWLFIGKSARSG